MDFKGLLKTVGEDGFVKQVSLDLMQGVVFVSNVQHFELFLYQMFNINASIIIPLFM